MYRDAAGDEGSYESSSCSDCRMELVQKIWTQLLLNWLNTCVQPNTKVKSLNLRSLVEIINKYKNDICADDIDRAILCTDDLEPFLRYKYPLFRLRYFTDDKDLPKKLYMMTSVLLFHCCVNSLKGKVIGDICDRMDKGESEMILRFCERLTEMEITLHNLESAIRDAIEEILRLKGKRTKNAIKQIASKSSAKGDTTQSESLLTGTIDSIDTVSRKSSGKFKSSITVMPSCLTDSSSYSKTSIQATSSESARIKNCDDGCSSPEVKALYTVSKYLTDDSEVTDDFYSKTYNKVYETQRAKEKVSFKEPVAYKEGITFKEDVDVFDVNDDADVFLAYSDNMEKKKLSHTCAAITSCASQAGKISNPGSKVFCCNNNKIESHAEEANSKTDPSLKNEKKRQKDDNTEDEFKPCVLGFGTRIARICRSRSWLKYFCGTFIMIVAVVALLLYIVLRDNSPPHTNTPKPDSSAINSLRENDFSSYASYPEWVWKCKNKLCERAHPNPDDTSIHVSLSRCTLLCSEPQLWPYPIGFVSYAKKLVFIATSRMEFKFKTIPSETVNQYLAEAFKIFVSDLAKIEKIDQQNRDNVTDFNVKKLNIIIEIESDPDPRLRLNTDESYQLVINTGNDKVEVRLLSASFCGVRHGLETLSQLMLLDQTTGYLITWSRLVIKDSPSYKYRGIMIDTGRNFIPVPDLLRTVDAMSSVKLNTLHWRISDAASFPLRVPGLEKLIQYGAFDESMVYSKVDVKTIVSRAAVRGIRVLIEIATPSPVGRAWSWAEDAICPRKINNFTCDDEICIRLKMTQRVFNYLERIYSYIISITGVDDVFHLSDGAFSLTNCYFLMDGRDGYLDKALETLRVANRGFLPKLPIIWYTDHLKRFSEAKSWERFGVQLNDWPGILDESLKSYRLIHSSKWDLSCEMKKSRCMRYRTWQEMYAWKSWQTINSFSNEGGEAVLWTDLVDSGNLDYHLWPRAAAVAERLWSDIAVNASVTRRTYMRLDSHRWRMVIRGYNVQPIWPLWCNFNPSSCLIKVRN